MAGPGPEEGGGEAGLAHALDPVRNGALVFSQEVWLQEEAFTGEQDRGLLRVPTGDDRRAEAGVIEPVELAVTVGSHG